jgi:1,2-diacylglycerol 3-beta-galactosyltransferase
MDEKLPALRVLILTADAGFGHRSAAKAVAEALQVKYDAAVEATIVNPLDSEQAPFFLRDSQDDYDRWVQEVPELYKLAYEASDNRIPTRIMEDSLGVLLYDAIEETFKENKPDVVLNTYPMYQAAITRYLRHRKMQVPVFSVITDLATVHGLWFHKEVDGCLVPTEIVARMAMRDGVLEEKVHITGIPVYPDICRETRSKEEIREALEWQTGITTILAVGSRRSKHLVDMLNVINHFGAALQLAVVTGKNEEMYQALQEKEWHIPVHLYNYVDNMPSLMKASDLILCKAGGLIVTESLACGLPLVLTDIIPGQETGNAEYVKSAQAGVVVDTKIELLESLQHFLLNEQAMLKQYTENARAIGHPKSAFKVAKILWESARPAE